MSLATNCAYIFLVIIKPLFTDMYFNKYWADTMAYILTSHHSRYTVKKTSLVHNVIIFSELVFVMIDM